MLVLSSPDHTNEFDPAASDPSEFGPCSIVPRPSVISQLTFSGSGRENVTVVTSSRPSAFGLKGLGVTEVIVGCNKVTVNDAPENSPEQCVPVASQPSTARS